MRGTPTADCPGSASSMKTTRLLVFFVLALSCSSIIARADARDAAAHWKSVLSKVQVGMRRAAVEKALSRTDIVLDIDPVPPGVRKAEKKGRTALYILDEEWCAAITFDSTGFTTRNNPYLVLHLPENRVIAAPQLLPRTAAINEKIKEVTSK